MNDALKMQISAFVDDELPKNESELLLRRLSQDASLRRQAAAYFKIGRLMRGERELPGSDGLRDRIAAALGEQPEDVPATVVKTPSRLLKPAAGLAVAASVAAVALFSLRQVEAPDGSDVVNADYTMQSAAVGTTPGYTEPSPDEVMSAPGDILTQYYLSHGATSADLGANGILTRLVTLELREGELVEVTSNPSATDKEAELATDDRPDRSDKK